MAQHEDNGRRTCHRQAQQESNDGNHARERFREGNRGYSSASSGDWRGDGGPEQAGQYGGNKTTK